MKKLYKREFYLNKIRGFYDDDEIIKVVTGVRRCGKYLLTLDRLLQRRSGIKHENIIKFMAEERAF